MGEEELKAEESIAPVSEKVPDVIAPAPPTEQEKWLEKIKHGRLGTRRDIGKR